MSFNFKNTFPDLATEIETKLLNAGHDDFVEQLETLMVTDRCRCGDGMCASMIFGFYSQDVSIEEEHLEEVLISEPLKLEIIAYKGKIIEIEVLSKPTVKSILDKLIPIK